MCVFCKIVAGQIPAKQVHEDELCVAIQDLNPQAPVHALVIPKEHVATITELGEGHERMAGHLLRVGAKVAAEQGVAQSGYRLVFNTLGDAGQTVFHIHLHVLGGRPMGWPPG